LFDNLADALAIELEIMKQMHRMCRRVNLCNGLRESHTPLHVPSFDKQYLTVSEMKDVVEFNTLPNPLTNSIYT
jgi:hypothetical protein